MKFSKNTVLETSCN